jgi:hypothetical protein
MAEISKQALKVDNNQSFPNNNNGAITPSILRAFNVNMIDSMVDEIGYNADSASWNVSISNINAFTSSLQTAFVSTASFNAFTSSINAYTASNNIKWNNAEVATASLFTSVANLNQFTASQVGAFTELNLFSASAKISIAALNQASSSLQSFTQSANVSITNLNTTTASLNTSVTNINTFTASAAISITNLNASSASQQVSIDSLNSKTGSYATTGSNTFTSANTFTSISASSFVSASQFVGDGSKITNITASIALPILDEGIPQGNAVSMNFTGSAISAIVVGGTAVVSVNVPDTGSFNALTASYNSFTASTNADLNAIHQATASLQAFTQSFSTSSLVSTSSFNAYTASNDQRVTSLETNSASVNISITNVNSATASLFTSVNNLNSTTASLNTSVSNLNSATSSLFGSASLALTTASFNNGTRNLTFTKGDNQTFSVNIPDVSGSAEFVTTASFNAYTASNDQKVNSLISATGSYATTGSNTFIGNQTLTGSLFVSGNINMVNGADIVTHHVKAPGVNGVEIQTNTGGVVALFGAGGSLGTTFYGQINATSISASTINGLGDPLAFSTSVDSRLDNLEGVSGSYVTTSSFNAYTASNDQKVNSLIAATGSYATTGSNTFRGLQSINFSGTGITQATQIVGNSTQVETDMYVDGGNYDTFNVLVSANNGVQLRDYNNTLSVAQPFISVGTDAGELTLHRNTNISGNLDIQSTLTASLQQGFTYVGNASGITTTVATSSFATNVSNLATTGSNNFVGNQTITGSLILSSSNAVELQIIGDTQFTGSLIMSSSNAIELTVIGAAVFTGSVAGNVVSASITSNTASIDFNLGNYFEVTSSVTPLHLNVTNIKPGTTSTLIVSASASSSILFSPNVAQPSGSAYSGSLGSIDILSLVAFNTSKVNLVATKALV